MRALPARVLVVTDRHQAAEPLPALAEALAGAGLLWLWLRDKDLPPAERRALGRDLAARLARRGATLTIGADAGLAAECGAGLHLGAGSDVAAARRVLGPGALIGISAHGAGEIRAARDAGADYATLSPVFPSPSKPGYGPALGLEGLAAAAALGLPLLALGGVTPDRARHCLAAGAAGVAVMGAAMRAEPGTLAALAGL